jgi:catechol 2,3-dioxygenase-like lactoylglutathione lyase family enzyme
MMSRPPLGRVLETNVFVEDVERSLDFYGGVFGFPVLISMERIAALDVEGQQVLLLSKKGASTQAIETPGGVIPPHDGEGSQHLAFAINAEDLDSWEAWLVEQEVEVESKVHWEEGGQSLYFRDPDGNLLELVTPGCWKTY